MNVATLVSCWLQLHNRLLSLGAFRFPFWVINNSKASDRRFFTQRLTGECGTSVITKMAKVHLKPLYYYYNNMTIINIIVILSHGINYIFYKQTTSVRTFLHTYVPPSLPPYIQCPLWNGDLSFIFCIIIAVGTLWYY